jgi:dynein heavy chain
MRDRHWQQVTQVAGLGAENPMEPRMKNFTLDGLVALGLLDHVAQISSIGERSGKEYAIEMQLNKMYSDWEGVFFDCKNFNDNKETYILKGSGLVSSLLDEHIVREQAMEYSILCFNSSIMMTTTTLGQLILLLTGVNDNVCLEAWLKVHQAWMYLAPILYSPNITMKHLPAEGKL